MIANAIIDKVTNVTTMSEECNVYYVDGPGGTGKIFVNNYLVVELSPEDTMLPLLHGQELLPCF